MLTYTETNWKSSTRRETQDIKITFEHVKTSDTIQDQTNATRKISLVGFLDKNMNRILTDVCKQLKQNNDCFLYDNTKFHCTLLGFPKIAVNYDVRLKQRIQQFSEKEKEGPKNIKFDLVRLGTMYEGGNTLKPEEGVSNGTVVAVGDNNQSKNFTKYGDGLSDYILKDPELDGIFKHVLRRRFPTVWCTLGYYTRDFEITREIEVFYNKFRNLNYSTSFFTFELGKFHYKDLRDWETVKPFSF